MAGTGTNRFVDVATGIEVKLRLPLEVDMEPDQTPKGTPIFPGAVGLGVVIPDLGEQRRHEPPGGAKPKWARHGSWIPHTPGPCRQLLGARALPVGSGDVRFAFEMTSPTYAGSDSQLPGTEAQMGKMGHARFMFGIPSPTYPGPDKQ